MYPVFEAFIKNESDGIEYVSLVDMPAIESEFMAFQKEHVHFSIQNEEQRIVFGPLMRADYPIYRKNKELGDHYVKYSKETIKKIAEKLMFDKAQNSVNLMHSMQVDGVTMIEMFLKDVEKGINPKGFEDVEDGSLFAAYKVNNDAVWDLIKRGEFKGFSIEGIFSFKKEENFKKMTLKGRIMNALVKFGEITTDKGLIYWVGDEDLREGDEVFNGEAKTPLEDGEYTTEDGKTIKVVDGKVAEIVDPKAEIESKEEYSAEENTEEKTEDIPETIEAEKTEEKVEESAESKEEESKIEENTTEEPNKEENVETEYVPKAEYDALKADIDTYVAEIQTLKRCIEEINTKLSIPQEAPIEKQFEAIRRNDKKMGNAARILSHLKD